MYVQTAEGKEELHACGNMSSNYEEMIVWWSTVTRAVTLLDFNRPHKTGHVTLWDTSGVIRFSRLYRWILLDSYCFSLPLMESSGQHRATHAAVLHTAAELQRYKGHVFRKCWWVNLNEAAYKGGSFTVSLVWDSSACGWRLEKLTCSLGAENNVGNKRRTW